MACHWDYQTLGIGAHGSPRDVPNRGRYMGGHKSHQRDGGRHIGLLIER